MCQILGDFAFFYYIGSEGAFVYHIVGEFAFVYHIDLRLLLYVL